MRTISRSLINVFGGFFSLCLCYLSDRYGRRPFMILSVFLAFIGMMLLLNYSEVLISAIGIAFGNGLIDFLYVTGFTYNSEILTKKNGVKGNLITFLVVTFGSFCSMIFVFFSSNSKSVDVMMIVLLIPFLLLTLIMKESLYFMYANNKKKEFFENIKMVADLNNVKHQEFMTQIQLLGINKQTNKQSNIK